MSRKRVNPGGVLTAVERQRRHREKLRKELTELKFKAEMDAAEAARETPMDILSKLLGQKDSSLRIPKKAVCAEFDAYIKTLSEREREKYYSVWTKENVETFVYGQLLGVFRKIVKPYLDDLIKRDEQEKLKRKETKRK